ncbi:hypothetical protein OG948_58480 (plasmid) [Embleya sp. NBC_00888]|uniref:hypothetical protein n=1 Tax=Embleya sp. NBC_00888 TaxID=2975960 RepID=UPI002F9087CA|nr:hypothetical protein OG948_58480 [Embleya sp. NBC_00888]
MSSSTRSTAAPVSGSASPLQVLEATFRALSRGSRPLTLPADLVAPVMDVAPGRRRVCVDRVRAQLRGPHASALAEVVWPELIRRARRPHAQQWVVVAAAVAAPSLRRLIARRSWRGLVERADLEQEMLGAFLQALLAADPDDPRAYHGLRRAADLAAYHLIEDARQHARNTVALEAEAAARRAEEALATSAPASTSGADPASGPGAAEGLLERAVSANVVSVEEAELIAVTRIDGVLVRELTGGSPARMRAAYRRRRAAEHRLREAITAEVI